MKIISIIVSIACFLFLKDAGALSIIYSTGDDDSGIVSRGPYNDTYITTFSHPHSDLRFNSELGTLTGVTISMDADGEFYIIDNLESMDSTALLTVLGSFQAAASFCDCQYFDYNESFNISGNGIISHKFSTVKFSQSISQSDWSKFVNFHDGPPLELFKGGATLRFSIISLNPNAESFVGAGVRENVSVKYDYDLPAGVPEPAICALMLIGLGALRFVSRRRKAD